ncbi:hypothetical protein [Micromonospora kangleipakensis]|uniref:hypothetical protein n=1 Tax=Micromonospora kangleipakensis TaxID=1077942 RepID=UPI001029DBDA|nr:hypothetical protein [Micromonospora kangleipakensis]
MAGRGVRGRAPGPRGPEHRVYPNYGRISTIAPAGDGRTVYLGTDDGRVWVTRDLGASWQLLLSGQPG